MTEPTCATCERPTIDHERGECEAVEPSPAPVVNLWDLPIFAWAWREDARDLERY